jgi:hypothetical protein
MALFSIHIRYIGFGTVAAILASMCSVPGTAQSTPSNATPVTASQSRIAQPESKVSGTKVVSPAGHRSARKTVQPAQVVETRPADPPPPNWPANSQAQPASVGWNGRELKIAATNSSLKQVLADISTATGVTVEGAGNDLRIFGSYGPASAREVLSELLEGSGYNVLMIGDQGEGTPRELVLTAKAGQGVGAQRQPGMSQQSQNGDDDAQEDVEPQDQQPEPIVAPPHPANILPQQPPDARTPQQMLQEMQQRQQLQQQVQPGVQPPNQ